ncbi:MAG: 6-pyruvoyl-tetrahydropterin synthase-related protein [Anaerolineae bacterium]|nr:6-pyruvoyl-tetrahydropterin synthase-related protein [Anaerolineae bacterium]
MQQRLNKFDWGIIAALLLPLIAALLTWGEGIVAGADVTVHVHRIHAMSLALQNGVLWPRWISYLHLGYGYPIFNFYAPGYAYFTALLELVGFSITTAYNLVQTLAWSFGSVGMYLLARRFLPAPAALLAAALWVYAPSRLYEVWWQGSLAQIVSASFMPYLMLGVAKTSREPNLRRISSIALPFAALILTHTPMMYIAALYAAPFAFVAPIWYSNSKFKPILHRWLTIGTGFALGIGLASIFLLPMLVELQYVAISQGINETFNYLNAQFLPISEIFMMPRLLDSTDLYLDFPRTLGLVGGILSLLGMAALIKRKQWGLLLLTVFGLGFTLFMLVQESLFLWLAIPGFANLRFPARLLRMGAVLIGILGGASILLLPKRYQIIGMGFGIVVIVAQIMPIIKPYDVWLNWDNISALDEIEQEATDRTWGTVSYNEFNPIWGATYFLDVPSNPSRYVDNPFQIRVFGRDIAAVNWQGYSQENITDNTLRIITDEARAVRFRQYYFPGWQATVNGEPAEIYPEDELGLITLDLAAGEYIVTLEYVGTVVQKVATALSLISIVIAVALFRLGKSENKSLSVDKLAFKPAMSVIVSVVIFALFNHTVIQENNWFKYQSSPTQPRYMQTSLNIRFGEDMILLGYTLHGDSITPNDPIQIDLYWHTPNGTETNYRPQVQLLNLTQSAAWAVSNPLQPYAGETSRFTPDYFARDPHVLRLNNADTPPYVGQIMIQLFSPDGALTLPDGSDKLLLDPLIRIETANTKVNNRFDYQLGDSANLTCASIVADENQFLLDLYWNITGETERELVVMVHGLDESGTLIENGDGAPFGGDYPSILWRDGQTLHETRTLPYNSDIASIAVSLYTRDTTERLSVTDNNTLLPDNQILLPITEYPCSQ